MPGLNQMSSTSSAGASVITLQFNLDARPRRRRAGGPGGDQRRQNLLPQDLPAPPIYAKVNPADAPVLTLGVTSEVDAADRRSRTWPTPASRRRSRRSGRRRRQHQRRPAAGGAGRGQPARARRLWTEPRRSAHHHQQRQLRTAQGHASTARRSAYTINTNDQIQSAAGLRQHGVAYKNGAPVRLKDVATLSTAPRTPSSAAWMNTHAGADPQRAAPAGRQRRRRGRPDQGSCCRS